MSRFKIIEILIEKETGRIVNGQAVWEELEKAVAQCEDEDGLVTVTGSDDQKERWEYNIELHRNYDEETSKCETDIKLLSISILTKKQANLTRLKYRKLCFMEKKITFKVKY